MLPTTHLNYIHRYAAPCFSPNASPALHLSFRALQDSSHTFSPNTWKNCIVVFLHHPSLGLYGSWPFGWGFTHQADPLVRPAHPIFMSAHGVGTHTWDHRPYKLSTLPHLSIFAMMFCSHPGSFPSFSQLVTLCEHVLTRQLNRIAHCSPIVPPFRLSTSHND